MNAIVLRKDETRSLGRPLALRVVEGTVWVTVGGDDRDHVVRAGDRFTPEAPGAIVATAVGGEPAVLAVSGRLQPRGAAA